MGNNSRADLENFVAVVEAGSFTQAAVRMGRSKAGVSRQVKGLEERLGVRLLNRTTRSLSLTESGAALFERSAAALAELRDAEAEAALHQVTPRGQLRVSLPVSFGHRVVVKPLLELIEEHPELELDLSFTDRYVDLVNEGFDFVVRIGNLADSTLVARRLGETQRVICAAPDYLERHSPPEKPTELMHHSCLQYSQQAAGSAWRFADGLSVNVSGRVRADSGDALLDAVRMGAGIAWLPDFFVREDLTAGRLVRLLEAFETEPLGIWVVFPHRRHLSLKVRLAIDSLAVAVTT